MNYKLKQKLKS